MHKEIKHRWFYAQSPHNIWEYLTRAELIAEWLMENDFQPVVGYNFPFRTRPLPNFDFDGTFYCWVLEIIPLKKLFYTWKGGPGNGKFNLDSIVTLTLTEKDNGTELLLEHTGKMENANIYTGMNEGWLKNAKKIADPLYASAHGTTSS